MSVPYALLDTGGERYKPTHLHLCNQTITEDNLEFHSFV